MKKTSKTEGFQWLDCHQEEACVYAFERKGTQERIAAVFHFSDQEQKDYKLTIPDAEKLELLLSSNDARYGGSEADEKASLLADKKGTFSLQLAPFTAKYYKICGKPSLPL